ncbi:MAG: transporter related, partial [Paenibacillus sp.]|nr:transporter related [Paenibacillus sp.]
KMAERIVELRPDGIRHFLGNYDDMLEKKLEIEEARQEALAAQAAAASRKPGAAAEASAASNSYEAEKQAKREERNKQRKLETLEAQIAELEGQISALEEQLTDPAIFNDYVRIQEIQSEIDERKQSLTETYEQWEALM